MIFGLISNPGLPAPYSPGNPDNSPNPSGGRGASTPQNSRTPGLWGLNLYDWIGCPGPDFGTFLTFNADPQKLVDAWHSSFAVGVVQAATPDITWSYENPSPGAHRFHATLPSVKELAVQFVWVTYDYFDVWAAADTCEGYGYLIFFG